MIIDNTLENFDASALPLDQAHTLTEAACQHSIDATVIFISIDEMFRLNNELRGKQSATDVLSLPFDPYQGEIYLCPEYVFSEGYDQDRLTHLYVHGLLHLAGFTHDGDDDFEIMSQHERHICKKLGLKDPYP